MHHPQIFARAFNTPLLVEPAKAQAFVAGFGPRLFGAAPDLVGGVEALPEGVYRTAKPLASILDRRLGESIRAGDRRPYTVIDGVAVIPVTGTLVHRGAWLGNSSGQTSYEGIAAQIEAAREDGMVRAIALEIDSFGGEVAGCFALAKLIRQARETKPVTAFIAEHGYSAAYALASQASRIVVPPTGGVGSVGVIMMHTDFSGALEAEGITVTLIRAGAHKGEGNPYEPLPDDVRTRLEGEMEQLRGMFAETVGAGRGDRLDAAAALATEAATFMGAEAVTAGLADAVAEPREAFEALLQDINGGQAGLGRLRLQSERSTSMDKDPKAGPTGEDTPDPDKGSVPAANAGDERQRIAAILNSPEAEGRADLAKHLAFETDLDPMAAEAILKTAAKSATGALAGQMAGDDTDLDTPEAEGAATGPRMVDRVKKRFA